MSTEPLEQAIATTRAVLTTVSKEQLGDATPCAQWKVSDLINHIVGGQYFFEAGAKGEPPAAGETDFSAGDFVAAFDEGAQRSVAAFRADGVMDKMLTLPFGHMPGLPSSGLPRPTRSLTGGTSPKRLGRTPISHQNLPASC